MRLERAKVIRNFWCMERAKKRAITLCDSDTGRFFGRSPVIRTTKPSPSPPHLNHSTHHEPERLPHTTNKIFTLQRYLENNRRAEHRDPFEHLKSLPEVSLPRFRWSDRTGQGKAVCMSTTFQRPDSMFPSVFIYRLGLITSVKRTN